MGLTVRQERFVDEYLVDLNGAAAATRAGFAANSSRITASRLLAKANIKTSIARNREQTAEKLQIQREDVIKELLNAFEIAKVNKDPRGMVAACSEINRMLGFYEGKNSKVVSKYNAPSQVTKDYEGLTDRELIALINPTR